jgi:hypothetical protein
LFFSFFPPCHQKKYKTEITDALGTPLGDDIDEDELEAEFAALEEENAMEEMDRLPGVPTRVPSLGDSGRKLAQEGLEGKFKKKNYFFIFFFICYYSTECPS